MSLTNATPLEVAIAARDGSRRLAILPTSDRNDALIAIHNALHDAQDTILRANAEDLAIATEKAGKGELSSSLVKRLSLSAAKFQDMLQGILDVRALPDPDGLLQRKTLLDDGLVLQRRSCPIGVLLIIFEARPEVIANISALAIKSGNAAILKGGKESTQSFKAISSVISKALSTTRVPQDCLQLVQTHDIISDLLRLDQHIDLVIPRGGNKLVSTIKSSTSIPVLGHADGLCTIYLCADAPLQDAVRIIFDAKCSYPAGCNAVETLLVDEDALETHLPTIAKHLVDHQVTLHCDAASKAALSGLGQTSFIVPAMEKDFNTEFLSFDLAIKTIARRTEAVDALIAAVEHINTHSSHHTDAILTSSEEMAKVFQNAVDSSSVYWNTSTRMADGQRYGFGTEVGISTNKIHSRGPVGLEGLMIYKWTIDGSGQVSADYGSGEGKKKWKHVVLPIDDGSDEWRARDAEELDLLRNHRLRKVNGHGAGS